MLADTFQLKDGRKKKYPAGTTDLMNHNLSFLTTNCLIETTGQKDGHAGSVM